MTASSDRHPSGRRDRRRRLPWAVRWIVLPLVLVVLGLFGAARLAEPWLQARLVGLAAEKADSRLHLTDLEVTWWPLGVRVEGVSLRLEAEQQPYVAVDSLSAQVDAWRLLRGRLRVNRVVAQGPLLNLSLREDGSLALPQFSGGGDGGRVELGSVELHDGEVRWSDGRVPLKAVIDGLNIESTAVGGDAQLAEVAARRLSLDIQGQTFEFAVDGQVKWDGAAIDDLRLHATEPQLDATITGSWQAGDGEFEIAAEGDLAILGPWLSPDATDRPAVSGATSLTARITNTDPRSPEGWTITGEGLVTDVRAGQFELEWVPLRFDWTDSRTTVTSDGLQAYGGTWDPSATMQQGAVDLEVSGDGISLRGLVADLGWDSLAGGGRVSVNLDYHFDESNWRDGTGDARVDVAQGGDWTLAGQVPVTIRPGLVLALSGRLADARSSVGIDGEVDIDHGGDLDLALETTSLPDVVRQLGLTGEYLPTAGAGRIGGIVHLLPDGGPPSVDLEVDLRNLALASLQADTVDGRLRINKAGVQIDHATMVLAGAAEGDASTLQASAAFPADGRPTRLEATAVRWPVEQLLPLVSLDFPLGGVASGTADLVVDAALTEGSVKGLIDLTLSAPTWEATELGGVVGAQIRIDAGAIAVKEGLWVNSADGQLEFSTAVDSSGSWEFEVAATAFPISKLIPLVPVGVEVDGLATGTAEGTVSLAATDEVSVDAQIGMTLADPVLAGTVLGGVIQVAAQIDDNAISLRDGSWLMAGDEIAFSGTMVPQAAWQVEARGQDLAVGKWRPELEFLGPDYRVSLQLSASGKEEIDSAELDFLTAVHSDAEPEALMMRVEANRVRASGNLAGVLRDFDLAGELTADGPRIDAEGVVQLLDWIDLPQLDMEGSVRLAVSTDGSWHEPIVVAEGSSVELNIAGQVLRELEPMRIVYRDERIELESAYLQNPHTGGELFAAGTIDLDTEALDGFVQADLDAVWLHALVPELNSTGSLSFLGSIAGEMRRPILDGQGQWSDGSALLEGLPHTMTGISMRFLTGSGGIVVDRAQADLAGGSITATGNLDFDPDRGLSYSARMAARQVNVNFPEDWWIGGDATLRINGDTHSRLISGDLRLNRAVLLQSVDLSIEQLLRSAFARQREWVPPNDPLLRSTRLQLQVSGEDVLQVTGEGLDLSGDIDLSIGGDLSSPVVLGRVDLSSGGEIVFRNNDFEIERGVLVFANPHVIDPDIDLVAVSEVRNYDVRLHLRGTLEVMDVKFTSEPSLPSLEVVSLLTTGQIGRQPLLLQPLNGGAESAAAEGLLAGQAAEAVGSRVGKLFGLDRVQVDPLTESSGSLSSARITVGKRLSERLVATYSYDPTDSEEQVVQIDWQLTPAVAAVLTQNGDGSYAVDFKWQQSF